MKSPIVTITKAGFILNRKQFKEQYPEEYEKLQSIKICNPLGWKRAVIDAIYELDKDSYKELMNDMISRSKLLT